jgi:hypothetical protein
MGVTNVPLRSFIIGSMLGAIPWITTCAYIGSAVNGVEDALSGGPRSHRPSHTVEYVAYGIGLAATILAGYLLAKYTKRAFDRVLRETEDAGPQSQARGFGEAELGEASEGGLAPPLLRRPAGEGVGGVGEGGGVLGSGDGLEIPLAKDAVPQPPVDVSSHVQGGRHEAF